MWGRGSKQTGSACALRPSGRPPCGGVDRNPWGVPPPLTALVAPRAGAWIETRSTAGRVARRRRSPPVRGRGSKQGCRRNIRCCRWSPPVRGRGSKPLGPRRTGRRNRRPPCGGVDRNIGMELVEAAMLRSPPVRGRGSKPGDAAHDQRHQRRPPCGGVDRNRFDPRGRLRFKGRPPCGGVDRNAGLRRAEDLGGGGRPPCGGVDRNLMASPTPTPRQVAPRAGRGSKLRLHAPDADLPGRPPCGGVDRNSSQ